MNRYFLLFASATLPACALTSVGGFYVERGDKRVIDSRECMAHCMHTTDGLVCKDIGIEMAKTCGEFLKRPQ
ncbi:MAG: hypothetical protein NXI16_17075 [Alphaproteobacteria bacterium]|nr:hypothetical protein [Alphaproteobacteria bacterium]